MWLRFMIVGIRQQECYCYVKNTRIQLTGLLRICWINKPLHNKPQYSWEKTGLLRHPLMGAPVKRIMVAGSRS